MAKKHIAFDTIPPEILDLANVLVNRLVGLSVDLPNVLAYVRYESLIAAYKRYKSIGAVGRHFKISTSTAFEHLKSPYLGRLKAEYLADMEKSTGPRKGI